MKTLMAICAPVLVPDRDNADQSCTKRKQLATPTSTPPSLIHIPVPILNERAAGSFARNPFPALNTEERRLPREIFGAVGVLML
jgi:hypothetical protein